MAKDPHISALIQLLSDEEKVATVKDLLLERSKYLKRIEDAQAQIEEVDKIIGRKLHASMPKDTETAKGRRGTPNEGTKPHKLTLVMGSTPQTVEEIRKALGKKGVTISLPTLRSYLGKYGCFKNIRGKGYTYAKSE